MHTIRSRGFTLIELLVVIAIIGVLSAVVLASLNTARQKGGDAAIKSNLDSIRTQAELEYGNQTPNQYSGTAITNDTCPTAVVANSMWDTTVINALKQAAAQSSSVKCNVSTGPSGTYAIWATLVTSTNVHCIDSTGASVDEAAPATGSTHC